MGSQSPLVLLLDDDARWLRSLRRLLVREGLSVLAFTDHAQLLSTLDSTEPGLVVLDYLLPTTNGAEVARRIRARKTAPPLVLLSSSLGIVGDGERELFDLVIDKALAPGAIVDLLREAVEGRGTSHRSGTRMRSHVTPLLEARRQRRRSGE